MEGFPSVLLAAAIFSGSQALFLALLLMTTAALLFRLRRRLNRPAGRTRSYLSADSPAPGGSLLHSDRLATVANRIEVQLHDSLREAQGRLDTKIAGLNQLIVDADRESSRLEDLFARLQAGIPSVPAPKNGHRRPDPRGGDGFAPASAGEIDFTLDRLQNPTHAKIYALADAGLGQLHRRELPVAYQWADLGDCGL